MNSFQHSVKQKMKAEINPGTASGSTILVRICQRLGAVDQRAFLELK